MIYEEKILDYLDGALGDKESAELMHQLSVSPERRVVLEQHLQLKSTISDARKPFAVPAAIEAKLAERIPVIASYNRELAGTAIIASAARSPFYGRIAAGIVILLLLGTVAYLGLERNELSSNSTSTTATTLPQASAPQVLASPSQTAIPDAAMTGNTGVSGTSNNISSNVPTRTSGIKTPRLNAPLSSKDLPPVGGPVYSNESDKVEDLAQQVKSDNEVPLYGTISAIDNLRSEPLAVLPIREPHGFKMRIPMEEESSSPFVLRFDYSLGQSYNQVRESDASISTRTAYAPSAGIDYTFSPHFSLGIEGGKTDISRVEEIAEVVNDEELGIQRVNLSHDVVSRSEFNARVMARFTPSPYDRMRIEASIGGGVAFGENIAPLASFSLTANYRLTEKLSLTFGPTFTGTFARSVSSQSVEVADGPVAFIAADKAASSTLFTPSWLFKAGIRITPW